MKLKDLIKKYLIPKEPEQQQEPKDTTTIYTFNVAGISYHYDELNKIINGLTSEYMLKKYQGMTNSEIIELDHNLCIYEEQYIKGCKLEPYVYKGKDAIKVILPDYKGKWYEVGNVPKNSIETVINLLEEEKITNIEFEIVGGDVKAIEYDDNNKPYIDEYDINYGVAIYITYKTE